MAVEQKTHAQEESAKKSAARDDERKNKKTQWQKPTLEDVSEEVMAQPYIRFT